jgi:hypothetical protein
MGYDASARLVFGIPLLSAMQTKTDEVEDVSFHPKTGVKTVKKIKVKTTFFLGKELPKDPGCAEEWMDELEEDDLEIFSPDSEGNHKNYILGVSTEDPARSGENNLVVDVKALEEKYLSAISKYNFATLPPPQYYLMLQESY